MARTMTPSKKSRRPKRPHPPARPQRSTRFFLLVLKEFLGTNREALVVSMAVIHLLVCLVFVAAFLNVRGPRGSRVFGETSENQDFVAQKKKEEPEGKRRFFEPVPTGLYLAFSVGAWVGLGVSRRRIAPRVFRVMAMLLAPGTAMVLSGAVVLLLNRS
ncbi:hypothetical protein JW916_03775 [Candidatus Sumerlaeota bacterium]|nr:hypothetical protein [Candidatus Sumerlaeota bacterium]